MTYSNRPYLHYLPTLKQTRMRRALALACFATLVSSCESDNNNTAGTFTIIPNSAISEPSPFGFTTLATTFDVYGTVVADAPERLVDQISLTAFTTAIDASGNAASDASGNLILNPLVFSPPLGNEAGGFYWRGTLQAPGLSMGGNVINATTSFDGGQESSTQTLGSVVVGSSWMKESAIQYDALGNLYALEQLRPAILSVDKDTGEKSIVVDLSMTDITNPVDFIINGQNAYVLNGSGEDAGIYEITDFAGMSQNIGTVSEADCAFQDAVAFDADFMAGAGENKYFVLDRGLKNIRLIQDDGDCDITPTPMQTVDNPGTNSEDDTVEVEGLLLDRPTDVVYHKANDTLFVSGQWVNFENALIRDESGEPISEDASGNPVFDASGNAVFNTREESFITQGNFVAGIPLSGPSAFARVPLEYGTDASGNAIPEVESAGALAINGSDLLVYDNLLSVSELGLPAGVVAIDVAGFDAASPEVIARPLSGGLRLRDGTLEDFINAATTNPNPSVPLSDAVSMAFNGVDEKLSVLSMQLGSYINIELTDPNAGAANCVDQESEPDNEEAALQCEFSGARTLINGGAAIQPANATSYVISGRAESRTVQLSSAVNSAFGFLAFNKPTGTPSLGFSPVLVDANDGNRVDQLLLSNGLALAATPRAGGADYLAVDGDLTKDRLMSFFVGPSNESNERSVVSEPDASVPFIDPLASFVRQPRIYDAMSDTVDASQPLFYYLVDRGRVDRLVKVNLLNVSDGIGEEFSEARGDRSLLPSSCDLGNANAIAFESVRAFTAPADFNRDGEIAASGAGTIDLTGDGSITSADDEGALVFYESYASVFVAAGEELLEIDLLSDTCISHSSDIFENATITSIDTTISESVTADENDVETRERVVSMMALDSTHNELIEISCTDDSLDLETGLSSTGLICNLVGTYPIVPIANQPASAAALDVDWISRNARVFDDKLNAVFLVDVFPRDAAGAPLSDPTTPGAMVTGQTVIEVRGLPLNCDPAMDAEGCLNL